MTGEFDTIRELLAPLAHPEWGRGLLDDVAVVPSRPGHDLVLTKDAIVEGVHFLPDDPLDTVAQKLLRVNLSDLAAKGAEPFGYLLGCGWSARCGWAERQEFVLGLARDQAAYGVMLLGGDTVSTHGPATFSATLMGWTPRGATVGRGGARPGDLVFVTGRIGDGRLGLMAAQDRLQLAPERLDSLIEHYRRPSPRTAFAPVIRELATASIDISDGLIADIGHIAAASGVRIDLDLEHMPVSLAGRVWLDNRPDLEDGMVQLATGGDDYELAFAVHPGDADRVRRLAEQIHMRVTAVGRVAADAVAADAGVQVRHLGRPVSIQAAGWTHD